MKYIFLVSFFLFSSFFSASAQKYFKFISTTQQTRNFSGFYQAVDTVYAKDSISIELDVKKNSLSLLFLATNKFFVYKTAGCLNMKGEGLTCSLPEEAAGSFVQVKDSEILLVQTERAEVKFTSLTPLPRK